MYLTAKRYLSNFGTDEEKEFKKKIGEMDVSGVGLDADEVSFNIHTWRKANAIHKWFLDNVQEGDDDCREYCVDIEQLRELVGLINKVLGADTGNIKEDLANSLKGDYLKPEFLPDDEEEYDEYYVQDLKETREMIEKILKNRDKYEKLGLFYSSSW